MDTDGAVAATGTVLEAVLKRALSNPYFLKLPPKTSGREQFGRDYAVKFIEDCRKVSKRNEDAVATATALTSASIADAYLRYGAKLMAGKPVDYIVSGGGARNATLMGQLIDKLKPHNCKVTSSDSFGLPVEAKEAAAFALLAWQTWHHRPGNLRSATGASRPAILGQVTYV